MPSSPTMYFFPVAKETTVSPDRSVPSKTRTSRITPLYMSYQESTRRIFNGAPWEPTGLLNSKISGPFSHTRRDHPPKRKKGGSYAGICSTTAGNINSTFRPVLADTKTAPLGSSSKLDFIWSSAISGSAVDKSILLITGMRCRP